MQDRRRGGGTEGVGPELERKEHFYEKRCRRRRAATHEPFALGLSGKSAVAFYNAVQRRRAPVRHTNVCNTSVRVRYRVPRTTFSPLNRKLSRRHDSTNWPGHEISICTCYKYLWSDNIYIFFAFLGLKKNSFLIFLIFYTIPVSSDSAR